MPSEDTQFKPGQSGNPAGRPKGRKSFPDALRKYFAMSPKQLADEAAQPLKHRDDITVVEAWALLTAAEGIVKGNISARSFALDRAEGKPKQTLDISGEPQKIEFQIVDADSVRTQDTGTEHIETDSGASPPDDGGSAEA